MAGEKEAWLLSAYGAASHRSWAEQILRQGIGFRWQHLELPARHFAWRIRGNPLSWLDGLPASEPALILATSMVDLATLKGLHPRLAGVPTLLYFHENQFAYPASADQVTSVEAQMVQLYGALAADRIAFNSEYNRSTFLDGIEALLRRLPDAVPAGITDRIGARSEILPVAIDPIPAGNRDSQLIVWNHRWEYDKAPEIFAEAMLALAATGADFRLALLGQRGRRIHPALATLRRELAGHIIADGELGHAEYRELLGRAAIVISTARHEFQGLAVMEACSAGACPLVPDDLCYPEYYPAANRYPPGDAQALWTRVANWLSGDIPATVDVTAYSKAKLMPRWQAALQTLLRGSGLWTKTGQGGNERGR